MIETTMLPIWQQIKKISDEVPKEEWDRVPANLATGESPMTPDPIEAVARAICRARLTRDYGSESVEDAWVDELWTSCAGEAMAAIRAYRAVQRLQPPDPAPSSTHNVNLTPEQMRRYLARGTVEP